MPPISESLLDTPSSHTNYAEIVLPPGTTLPQFASLQDSLVTTAIVVAIAFGVLICDYLHLLSHEIKLYQTPSKALWFNPATWAFVLLRYSGVLATFPALFLTSIPTRYCESVAVSSQVGVVLVVACSGLIFGFRVSLMWCGHKAIYAVVGMMYVIMLTCWCAVVSQHLMETGPPSPFGSNCHMRRPVSWAPIAYASSVAFDAVVLLLAAFKLTNSSSSSSTAGHAISRDTFVCFLVTAITNAAVLVLQVLGPSFNLVKPTIAPISTVITATLGARVYLDLQLFSQREPPVEQVLPITSMAIDARVSGTYTNPATLNPRRASSGSTTPQSDVSKRYPIGSFSLDIPRPDTPFGSYDYDSPKDTTYFPLPVFTRETVVTVE